MIQPNSNEEIILSSNNEITLLNNSNNNGEINLNGNDSNETTLPDNNIQSSDINKIDLEDSITNTTNSFSSQTIAIPFVGQVFETWDDVDKYLHEYTWQEKFIVIRTRNDRDPPSERTCRRRTYACDHQDTYGPKKSVILENQRNSKSKRTGCPWHVNINFSKKATVISVTSLNINHNHPLDPMTNTYATKNRTLPEAVEREICFYTAEGNLNATIQCRLLSAKFPNITIYPRDLQNLMQKYKVADRQENDASNLLRQLLTKKTEEPGWEVFWEINRETKSLDKVFWMSPEQVQLWMTYHDVILNDNIHKTNQFNMPLSLFTAIDNHFRTRLVAQALVNDETKETYEWLLTSTLQATNHTPRVFITDSDPGMDAAIDSQYSGVYPLHCIYHIFQNLMRNLKAPLGASYNDFVKDFYLCRNDLSPTGFDVQWNKLITMYPKTANYLNSELYSTGISSTSRVESENAVIKNIPQGRPSLCGLVTILDLRLRDEAQYVNYNEWYHANASAQLSGASAECFPEVDRILKKYLTEEMLSRQRHEIIQSLYYCTIMEIVELSDDKQTEKGYDTQQIHLSSLLEDLPPKDIIITYKVQRRNCVHVNFVIILTDRSHLCTCMLLINFGLICRHFWHIFAIDSNAFFHVTLIPRRWYNNEKIQDLHLDEQPYIKRRDYGETFGLARKAVRSAVKAGSESIYHLKKCLNEWSAEEQRLVRIKDNDKENFNPDQVENPIERRQKGRPAVKHFKSSTENKNSKNKCGKCGTIGHYAPTCNK
ncbi:hypothetical protein Glove_99g260 [Diversispora epigaea]|uniref:Uncharacterized protein n=1 Tax=Diversispora epigaea TaxID=1348612 RepID=A0A397J458_9GLOM|nr:hypothetical protein Glove_99g260 [Diversispora epigaea]